MPERSAGILLYRDSADGGRQVLLVHPGGPFWRKRDDGAWMIPKGLIGDGETALAAAIREFEEELGRPPPSTPQPLGTIRQAGGKQVEAFMAEGELDADAIRSNQFTIEWPPKSGRMQGFPEVDRAAWFTLDAARAKILPSQAPLLDMLAERLGDRGGTNPRPAPSSP